MRCEPQLIFTAVTALGPSYVVVTDGARGAFVGSRAEILFGAAERTEVVGTAGAGDALPQPSALILQVGCRRMTSLAAATVNAGSGVQHVDTQTGLLRNHEIIDRIGETKRAIRRWHL
jgi:ribokinase